MRTRSFLGVFLRYWLPVLAYVTLIFALSSIANLAAPKTLKNGDKLAHFGEYLLLGMLLSRAFRGSRVFASALACSLLAIVLGFATGLFDELFQTRVPGRISSAYDFLFDAAGVVVGTLLYALLKRRSS
jgi:VanZ family protein